MNKKKLYESIMNSVAKEVKKALLMNEATNIKYSHPITVGGRSSYFINNFKICKNYNQSVVGIILCYDIDASLSMSGIRTPFKLQRKKTFLPLSYILNDVDFELNDNNLSNYIDNNISRLVKELDIISDPDLYSENFDWIYAVPKSSPYGDNFDTINTDEISDNRNFGSYIRELFKDKLPNLQLSIQPDYRNIKNNTIATIVYSRDTDLSTLGIDDIIEEIKDNARNYNIDSKNIRVKFRKDPYNKGFSICEIIVKLQNLDLWLHDAMHTFL